MSKTNSLKRLTMLGAMMAAMMAALPAMGQAVIMNGNYYLTHNEDGTSINTTATTTFNPATCLWAYARRDYIRTANSSGEAINNNNNYLQYTSVSLGTDWGDWYRGNNNEAIRARITTGWTTTNYYLRLNGTTWQFSSTNSNNGYLYDVTISTVEPSSTNPTINGADVLTATGNSTYTASGASYRAGGYTNYRFNNTDHFFNGNTAITPANANITYSWSLADNAYATVSTSGVVTVSSLPEYDITLTLTVTATATGGTPAAPAGTTLTASKEIVLQGTKPSAPIISVSGNTATITTDAAGSTSIRYTLDGSNPTTSTGTVYSGAIDLSGSTTSPVTIKAVTVRNGNASEVSEQTVTLTLPEPTITINGEAQTATITSSVAGATIYYTTDGSTPTTSSSQYSGTLTGLAYMTTVKAIAVKDGWNNSPVASGIVTIPSGVSGGVVTLFDYEDHTWTYYSGVDASVDGGNYNTNYVGKLYSPNPRNVKITYNGVNDIANSTTTVKVSVDAGETQNQFIYYKTLEESATSGEYPYQVISNPFSVRPSTGTGNSKVYYGFAGWKIVSGGEYIKNHSNGDVLALDEEIVFNNLPYPSVNCTSAEIVFQTTWTRANVQSGTNIATMLSNFTGGTYETNFAVLTATYTTAWTGNKNATITSVMPDGSSDYRGIVTRLNVTVNAGYTIKYEYININNSNSTFTMGTGTKTLYIGRGVSNTAAGASCCNLIQGCNGNITGGLTYTLKIESGVYGNISYTRGLNDSENATISGTVNIKSTLGCDYDRATNNNNNLKFTDEMWFGDGPTLSTPTSGTTIFTCIVKSGMMNSSLTSAGIGDAQNSFYVGIGANYSPGHRRIEVEGGEFWSLAGGLDDNNATDPCITYRIRGGLFKGAIYGSAANATANGIKQMIFTGGTIQGWIGAGANGTANNGGKTNGISYVYIGGKTQVVGNNNTYINGSVGGNVFGAGSGSASYTAGEMTEGSNVVVADEAYVKNNVYGGGNFGFTDKTATVYITGGVVEGRVFGGANQNKGDYTNIVMTGGLVKGGVYGGCNTSGTIGYNVTMHINGGQVGTSSSHANIHGGGYGQPTRVSQNVDITLGAAGQTEPGVTVYGDVYGGSALGYVNGTTATTTYHTNVTLNKGTINGSLYGGGLGAAGTAANVYGPVAVKVYGGSVNKTDANGANGSGGVYGANNVNGAPQRSVTVDIYGTDPAPAADAYALFSVYGGGNAADYTYGNGYPTVKVHNCNNSIEYVYGGGNAAAVAATDVTIYGGNKIGNVFGGGNGTVTAANVTGNAVTKIYGGTIGKVFGGSNSQGTIGGDISVTVNKQGDTDPAGQSTACDMKIGELYGGGNMAASNVGSLSIGCTGDLTADHSEHPENIGTTLEGIGDVYGGANAAAVTGNVNLTIDSGMVYRVFGNNNTSASVSGTITVNIDKKDDACGWYVGYVYGGGNQAPYTAPNATPNHPAVNIKNGEVSYNVYGGGLGTTAAVSGNPQVILSGTAEVGGNVYGGGNAAPVSGNTKVTLRD